MKKLVAACLFTGLLTACNTNGDTKATAMPEDTVQEADADADVAQVQAAFPNVYTYLKNQDSSFSEDNFLPSGEAEVQPAPTTPIDEAHLEPFRPYLIFNSDSSRALDLYSYNYIIDNRNGSNKLEAGSPDSEAALIDFTAKKRRRIFFGGPSFALWDGKWIDAGNLLMIGAETGTDTNLVPSIWKINLKDTSIQVYTYQGTVQADMNGYQKSKLNKAF